jgi:hypothetical protein
MPVACPAATRSNSGWPSDGQRMNARVDLPQTRELRPTAKRLLLAEGAQSAFDMCLSWC